MNRKELATRFISKAGMGRSAGSNRRYLTSFQKRERKRHEAQVERERLAARTDLKKTHNVRVMS